MSEAHVSEAKRGGVLARMSWGERLGQLRGVRAIDLMTASGGLDEGKAKEQLSEGIGFICQPGDFSHARGLDKEEVKAFVEAVQGWLRRETRLGLPAIMVEECLSGLAMRGADVYPQMIGQASSWNPELTERMTSELAEEFVEMGISLGLSPVLDLGRDARLGRIEETFGEDPVLAAAFAEGYVRGLQGKELSKGVAAVGKHFLGQGGNECGHFPGSFCAGPRAMRHIWAYPFEAAIRNAGLDVVMHGYHEIDGIPCALNGRLLKELLREQIGFSGVVVSDYFAFKHLQDIYKICADGPSAAKAAMRAGVDVELPCGSRIMEWAKTTKEPDPEMKQVVLSACGRVLDLKAKLGLFTRAECDSVRRAKVVRKAKDLPYEIALESFVLLENKGPLLPLQLQAGQRIAVVGPLADDPSALCGDYAWPAAHRWQKHALLAEHTPWPAYAQALAEAGRERGIAVECVRGCGLVDPAEDAIGDAVDAALRADVTVAVVGELAGVTSGEGKDAKSLELTGRQWELCAAIAATGKPLVVLFACGRPLAFRQVAPFAHAVVVGWYAGQAGGKAFADLLFGKAVPCGRLPVSVAKSVGYTPIHYSRNDFTGYGPSEAAYPFGYGLSYSTFAWDALDLPKRQSTRAKLKIRIQITNTGKLSGKEVVQVYIRHRQSSCARPPWQLKGFAKTAVEPGSSKVVELVLPPDLLAEPDADGELRLHPGWIDFAISANASDPRILHAIEFHGKARHFQRRESFFAQVLSKRRIHQ